MSAHFNDPTPGLCPAMGEPMKWFMAISEGSPHFGAYCDMIRVAVQSARRHTQLEPHLLYYGKDNSFTAWARGRGVVIHFVESRFLADLAEVARVRNETAPMDFGPGVMLRMEIPRLASTLGWADSQILYTDCDVMFVGDPVPRLTGRTDIAPFAVAAENDRNNPMDMNSGVMLMNVPVLQCFDDELMAWTRENLAECCSKDWDQHAYRTFFAGGWARLDPVLNWKPYWEENAEAKIIHFHGPKPFLRDAIRAGSAMPVQIQLATGSFWRHCEQWDRALAEAMMP